MNETKTAVLVPCFNEAKTIQSVVSTFRTTSQDSDSHVVADNLEVGLGNKIPLWRFGFLY